MSMSTIEKVVKRLQHEVRSRGGRDAHKPQRDYGKDIVPFNGKLPAASTEQHYPSAAPSEIDETIAKVLGLPDEERAILVQEYRRIKRPLLMNAFGQTAEEIENGNIIMVTSSLPGEGKSYTAFNLALSICMEKDVTVLLVDCDVQKRALSKMMSLDKSDGLTNYLDHDVSDLSDVMKSTSITNLKFIPAGEHSQMHTELFSASSMRELVDELSHRYSDRIIIFDAPPLMVANEAQILAELVGQIVMVVKAEDTPQRTVLEALECFDENKIVGLVFNRSARRETSGYYGGYYG
jgi:receptor protein-tyrosine kinase